MRSLASFAALVITVSACASDEQDACFPLGHDDDVPRRASTGEKEQGIELQGMEAQGRPLQGEKDQGTQYQGDALALADLAGVRLELADVGEPVSLHDGRLVVGTRVAMESARSLEVVAITGTGERLPLTLTPTTTAEGDERVAIVANGWTVCAPDSHGMFVPGSWDETGAHVPDADVLTYACMDGVIAKCVDWGYAPWTVGAELHATCTRLARADYCGDGRSWTMNGTLVDVYDVHGVLVPTPDTDLGFEAAWAEHGAVCVHEARYDIVDADGESVVPDCFAALPACTSLAEATALGATMANASAHTRIDACE